MPRFGLSPSVLKSPPPVFSPPPVGSPQFSSPGLGLTTALGPGRMGLPHNHGPSVRLCCLGGSGTIFSLGSRGSGGEFFLERQTVPLSEEPSAVQKARLPDTVQTLLALSPPVELLCVDVADKPQKNESAGEGATFLPPCLLCLYSRKDVFYLEMKMDSQGGVIVEAKTVYDKYLLYAGDEVTIVRIRPAPQRRMDFATLCPRGAMAMLTNNPYSSEYYLVLQHNEEDDLVSAPLSFQLEESSEMGERITDFCFAQSGESKAGGLSLLSTLSVLLLKGSGQVHAASPILFDGSVVSKSVFLQALGLLEYHVEVFTKETSKGRRARAARKFLKDAFGDPHGPNKFLTARVFATGVGKSAVSWPVALQGPILTLPLNESFMSSAVSLENFEASDLIGVAIAHDCHVVDLCILSPSSLLPRFGLESAHDGYELDDALANAGACVQRLVLGEEEPTGAHTIKQSVSLVRDRMMDSMLHYVTPRGVTTLHTTAPRLAIRKVEGASESTNSSEAGKDVAPRSSAWSSVNATSARVQGVVIGDDPRFGHSLFVRLSDGSLVAENLSQSRYLHEMEHLINISPDNTGSDQWHADDYGPPLYEVLEPMLQKISAGVAGMGKYVGSQTPSNQVDPGMLAVALGVKERCDNEVVLPLLELKQTIRARRQVMKVVLVAQMKELSSLKKVIRVMEDRMTGIKEKAQTAQVNAQELAKRSDAVMQASHDLMPTLTQAEYDYFQLLKRLNVMAGSLERAYGELTEKLPLLREKMGDGRLVCNIDLRAEMKDHAQTLLDEQEKKLGSIEANLQANERQVQIMVRDLGLPN